MGSSHKPHLVESKEPQVFDDCDSGDLLRRRDLTRHLKTDLDDLQGVREHHLRSAGLRTHQQVSINLITKE